MVGANKKKCVLFASVLGVDETFAVCYRRRVRVSRFDASAQEHSSFSVTTDRDEKSMCPLAIHTSSFVSVRQSMLVDSSRLACPTTQASPNCTILHRIHGGVHQYFVSSLNNLLNLLRGAPRA